MTVLSGVFEKKGWCSYVPLRAASPRSEEIQEIFRNRMGIEDRWVFQNLWEQSKRRFQWSVSAPLDPAMQERIEGILRETLVYTGPGIEVEGEGPDPEVHRALQGLLGREGDDTKFWFNRRFIRSLFVKKPQAALEAMEIEVRDLLGRLEGVESPLLEEFVHHLLSLFPYFSPPLGAQFAIPQKVRGEWKLCNYRVDRRIALTPEWFATPAVAYGLVSEEGPPLLIFMGTTYPSSEGFVATVLSDFTPGMSVGHAAYWLGKKAIADWLSDKQGVRVFGKSLGGALAFHVLRHHEEKIDSVDAFNPPGLYQWDWKKKYDGRVRVNIHYQEGDLVGTMGVFPEGRNVSVYRVLSDRPHHILGAHTRIHHGAPKVTILKSCPEYENRRWERKILTYVHLVSAVVICSLALVFHLFYSVTVRPCSFILTRK